MKFIAIGFVVACGFLYAGCRAVFKFINEADDHTLDS
jgi:hypothetical protein